MGVSKDPFSLKQIEFIRNANARINLAHGAVRTGKTVCTLFKFLQEVHDCPGDSIWMLGNTVDSVFHNVISLLFESEELNIFRPFCTWYAGNRELRFGTKTINCLGAGDSGALGNIQGKTFDLCYCDEMTLYPDVIIDMIDSRLSRDHSKLYASMNPKHPDHKLKQWIDKATAGNKDYYSLHFVLDDNPFLPADYAKRLKESVSGLFAKRNILGLWCMAEGAIFEFFDRKIHVKEKPPRAAEYYVAGIDVGTINPFACVLVGVNTGRANQMSYAYWVEKEYYWNPKVTKRQKTNSEFADDIQKFLEPYGNIKVYIDPSAASMKEEFRRRKIAAIDANNDVEYGIGTLSRELGDGYLSILKNCPNLISEIESYVWDSKKSEKGEDAPLKKDDHCIDALRYVVASHKISKFDPDALYRKQEQEWRQQNWPNGPSPFR
jgi:PBSX family phage terminase large subunit